MNHRNLIMATAIAGALACGDDSPAAPDAGSTNMGDGGDGADGSADGSADGDAGGSSGPDAGGDGDTDGDGDGTPDGDGNERPMPIEVDCGGPSADECPVCANEATCDAPTYTDNGNGTVTSSCCGLVWQKAVEDVDRDWYAAHDYCENLTLAGGEYRLPTIAELQTLVVGTSAPTIDTSVFPNTPVEAYWSSSAGTFYGAWEIAFSEGATQEGDLGNSERVRCVRK